MPRYILIDDNSGYIWGDTADIDGKLVVCDTPTDACRAVDESVNEFGRRYTEHGPNYRPGGADAYHVYQSDIDGTDQIANIRDGTDQEMIDAVERDCRKVAVVTIEAQRLAHPN